MLVNEEDDEDEEEYEEEAEEETEHELSYDEEQEQSLPDFPQEEVDDLNSHATSYSDWYVIDEQEEARLKQIAFERYMAEKAEEERARRRELALKEKAERRKLERKAQQA